MPIGASRAVLQGVTLSGLPNGFYINSPEVSPTNFGQNAVFVNTNRLAFSTNNTVVTTDSNGAELSERQFTGSQIVAMAALNDVFIAVNSDTSPDWWLYTSGDASLGDGAVGTAVVRSLVTDPLGGNFYIGGTASSRAFVQGYNNLVQNDLNIAFEISGSTSTMTDGGLIIDDAGTNMAVALGYGSNTDACCTGFASTNGNVRFTVGFNDAGSCDSMGAAYLDNDNIVLLIRGATKDYMVCFTDATTPVVQWTKELIGYRSFTPKQVYAGGGKFGWFDGQTRLVIFDNSGTLLSQMEYSVGSDGGSRLGSNTRITCELDLANNRGLIPFNKTGVPQRRGVVLDDNLGTPTDWGGAVKSRATTDISVSNTTLTKNTYTAVNTASTPTSSTTGGGSASGTNFTYSTIDGATV